MAVGKMKSLTSVGVQAAADRQRTLDYGVADLLRVIFPPRVPLLSLVRKIMVIFAGSYTLRRPYYVIVHQFGVS